MAHIESQASGICTPTPARPSLLSFVTGMVKVRAQRRALLKLDAALLNDVGISAREAACEAAKPVWDIPSHWQN